MSLVAFLACFSIAKNTTSECRKQCFNMGRGGFEPPKQVAADLQSVPFGHSGIYPNAMKIFYMYFRLTVKKYIISSNHTQDFFLLVLDFLVSIKICINNFSFWFSKTLLPLYFVICIFGHLYIYIVLLKFCIMYCPAHVQTFCIYLFYVEFLTMGYSKNYIMYWGVFTVIIIAWDTE